MAFDFLITFSKKMGDWNLSELEFVRMIFYSKFAQLLIQHVLKFWLIAILINSNSDNSHFWHFQILTIPISDIFRFWQFPILPISDSDNFRFWQFPIPTIFNSDILWFWQFPVTSKFWQIPFSQESSKEGPHFRHSRFLGLAKPDWTCAFFI